MKKMLFLILILIIISSNACTENTSHSGKPMISQSIPAPHFNDESFGIHSNTELPENFKYVNSIDILYPAYIPMRYNGIANWQKYFFDKYGLELNVIYPNQEIDEYLKTGKMSTKDIWGNMNSQESVGLSPNMYKEFIFPIFKKAAERFGLVYYGCCEPVHEIWESCVSKLANLRKVSISPWCNEEFMGEALRGTNVIYSRKPSPNYLGVGSFDEEAFTLHIKKTILAARGGHAEILFRDIYTLTDDITKAGKAVKIVRKLIEDFWR